MENSDEPIVKLYPASLFDFEKRALSYSTLKAMLRSPLHFAYNWFNKKAPTDAMIIGNIIDCKLLTPDDFKDLYLVMPDVDGRTKEGKEMKAKFQAIVEAERAKGKYITVVQQWMVDLADLMKEALLKSQRFRRLYDATHTVQKTIRWTDKKTGFPLIAKMDSIATVEGTEVIWDLKSTTDAEKDEYPKQAINMDYPLQGATYFTGWALKTGKFAEFHHAVIENVPPFGTNVFRAPNDWMQKGKNDYRKALDRVKFCIEHDCFDLGYEYINDIPYDELTLPGWAKNK